MLTHITQAVLLLTAHFSRPAQGDPKPLTPTEWGRFALWLKAQRQTPEALLAGDPSRLLGGWGDDKIPMERICDLLSRSPALALALEKWQRAGLWVITRSDPDYPVRLKQLLKNSSPPLFFGCGNRQLLNRGGLTVVGSRNATQGDLDFAHKMGGEAAEAGYSKALDGCRGKMGSWTSGSSSNDRLKGKTQKDESTGAVRLAPPRAQAQTGFDLLAQNPDRPDICIGTDDYHTPLRLFHRLRQVEVLQEITGVDWKNRVRIYEL